MFRRTLAPIATIALLLCLAPTAAHALFGTPGPGDRILPPPSQYFLPMEAGALDSHLDLQLMYTMHSIGVPGLGETSRNVVQMGLDGQIALLDRFQVGVNVPFLNHNGVDLSGFSLDSTQFGNMLVKLKVRLLGSSSGPFALSVFANTLLPTGSGLATHDFAAVQPGVALSAGFSRISLNADFSIYESFSSDTNFVSALMLNVHAALKVLFLAPYLGFQFFEPMAGRIPDLATVGHAPGVSLSAGVQLYPLSFLHIDVGTRIAFNDNGKRFFASLGQATLVFAAGLRF